MMDRAFYGTLKDFWYTSQNHSIALLRAKNAARTRWVIRQIASHFWTQARVLDISCGAGWLANSLALQGYEVIGLDGSAANLAIARKYDATNKVKYLLADPSELPLPDASVEVVCAMDILEHVPDPVKIIEEAQRVLRPGGLFLFHTYNRNLLSYLFVIKCMEHFVRNAPCQKHSYQRFIKPKELSQMCQRHGLKLNHLVGFQPNVRGHAFWKLLRTRLIPNDLEFVFCKSLLMGYSGVAKKERLKKEC